MAFFKSRSNNPAAEESPADDARSMDSLRQQARHRLIGATLLVVIAVVGFPLVFDTKPRDISADIRIDMPERESVRPSQPPVAPVPDKQALATPPAEEVVSGTDKAAADNAAVPDKTPAAPIDSKAVAAEAQDSKPADTSKTEPASASDSAAAGEAKGSEKSETAAPAAERFIVQVGAYSDESKVKGVRAKLEKAGYTTYVHVAQTKEGKRTRVRIGPFATRQEAQKVVGKIKSLNFNASVLTL
ncbi:MAG: SPOR domain-containing protein [Limnohabitans sp.]|nr:SPOR domain-containing protein [Limnohabitans sp.]